MVEEQTGIPGISITGMRGVAESVKPPRSMYLPFPSNATFGRPHNRVLQKEVLKEALGWVAKQQDTGAILDSTIKYG